MAPSGFVERLAASCAPGVLLTGDGIGPRYFTDVVGRTGALPRAVLRPSTTAEVSRLVAACHAEGVPVVTQGGMTGLVGGTLPNADEIVLSLERMNRIDEIDTGSGTATVEAGAVLQTVQDRVEARGFTFPLDLGARGSCTIGGNIATNAGGNRVIRYGMMRDLVLGLEVVMADGTVIDALRKYIKNNAGFDVKQYFIGSEGTLGIVTRAVLRIFPKPGERAVACCSLSGFAAVVALLAHARRLLGGDLTAFEVMWNAYYARAAALPHARAPLRADRPFYVLVEASGADAERTRAGFETVLSQALADGLIEDAVVAKSEADAAALWRIRDASLEVHAAVMPAVGFDVSLAIEAMEEFAAKVGEAAGALDPEALVLLFGHLGDGNLHVIVHHAQAPADVGGRLEERIYDLVGAFGGSISAEHGIGIAKRPYLGRSRTSAEIALMRSIKMAVDPKGILNPGRVIAIERRS